jgi:cobalt-precorrin-5B (C1)-methyltransferase
MKPDDTGDMIKGRLGYTTGACAAAAAKAATRFLLDVTAPSEYVEITLPGGKRSVLPVSYVRRRDGGGEAGVVKDAGDDPDITDGALVTAFVEWAGPEDVVFVAGEGVGTVTRKGLSIPPGDPAINPGPRKMIRSAVRELTDRPVRITVSIPGGEEMAKKTYNPRLGIVGGLSILGTTGRVRPFSCAAMRCSLVCELNVAAAAGIIAPVLVPGHIGERSVQRHLDIPLQQVIEVGNEWGFVLELFNRYPFRRALLWGHPGKLAKLADRQWDTHSSRSGPALKTVCHFASMLHPGREEQYPTTEALFAALDRAGRTRVAEALGAAIARAVKEKIRGEVEVSVVLVNINGDVLGKHGDLSPWKKGGFAS